MYQYFLFSFQDCLPEHIWNHLKKYFIENSYSVHPETLLYCAFVSSMSSYETKGKFLNLILEAIEHAEKYPRENPRIFAKPGGFEINFEADTIYDVLDWENLPQGYITVPPLLQGFSKEELILSYQMKERLPLPYLLSHSQPIQLQYFVRSDFSNIYSYTM